MSHTVPSTEDATPASTDERRQEVVGAAAAEQELLREVDALHTPLGDTTIADTVVQKLAGIAAREVPGVFAMGSAASRAIGSLTQRIPGSAAGRDLSGGVTVRKGELEAAIEISVVIEYGAAIVDVADRIRENVIRAVEYGTGLSVVSVDIAITDVHLPDDDLGDTPGDLQLR